MPLKDLLSADVGDQIPGLKPDIQISLGKGIKKGGPKIYHYLSGGGFEGGCGQAGAIDLPLSGESCPYFQGIDARD